MTHQIDGSRKSNVKQYFLYENYYYISLYIYYIIISQFKFTYVKEEIIKINKLKKIVL